MVISVKSIRNGEKIMTEIKCPYQTTRGGYLKEYDEYFYDIICELNDRYCLREYGQKCDTYEEWVEEND